MGRAPLIEIIGIVNLHADYWIMGSCEPYTEAWADGPITLFIGESITWFVGSVGQLVPACARLPLPTFDVEPTTPINTNETKTGGQGCNVTEAEEIAFDEDPANIPSGRIGGEWVGKLEHFRHENRKRREEKKHGANESEGGGHRRVRGRGPDWRRRKRRLSLQQVSVVRVQQEEEEVVVEAAASETGSFTPLGANFQKVSCCLLR